MSTQRSFARRAKASASTQALASAPLEIKEVPRMVDVVEGMYACRGAYATANTKVFRGRSGLRALHAAARVTATEPDHMILAVTRCQFRDSALTLLRVLGASVTIHVRPRERVREADEPPCPQPATPSIPLRTVHCALSGHTGENGEYDPAAMAASWFFDSTSDFDWPVGEGEAALVASVPFEAVADYVDASAEDSLLISAPRSTITVGIAGFGLALVNDPPAFGAKRTPVAEYAIDRFLQEMVGIVLVENRGATSVQRGPRRQLFFDATALISELYPDPALSPADLAGALSVGVRTLQQAFQEAGSSVSAEIRSQRARAARALLMQPKYDVLSLEELAAHCGYGSTETLRDGLRTHFKRHLASCGAAGTGLPRMVFRLIAHNR